MKPIRLLIASALVILSVASANVSRAQVTLQDLFDGATITVDDKIFERFVLNNNTFVNPLNPEPKDITVTPTTISPLEHGLTFTTPSNLPWTDPTVGDGGFTLDFNYDVRIISGPKVITDVHLSGDPSGDPNNPGAHVHKQVFMADGVTLLGSPDIHEGTPSDFAAWPAVPQTTLHVHDRVDFNNQTPGTTSMLTTFTQTYTQEVPEPGSIALLGGMLIPGAAILLRRRRP